MSCDLNPNEEIVKEAKISIAAVVVLWLSVPLLLLVGFCGTYLPLIIGAYAKTATMQALLDGIGAESSSFGTVFSAVREELFGAIPAPVIWFLIALLTLLGVCWFGWACVCTKLHFRYSLTITDSRVIGSAKRETLDAPFSELVNVFVGQSLMGRIFRYGSITVQTKRGSITVNNVCAAMEIKSLLMSKIED